MRRITSCRPICDSVFSYVFVRDATGIGRIANRTTGGGSSRRCASFLYTSHVRGIKIRILNCGTSLKKFGGVCQGTAANRHGSNRGQHYSSFIRIVPLKKKFNTRDIVEALISKIYCYHSMPQEIISDRGPQFVANYFTDLDQAFGVHLSPSTAFHQQTNGSTERAIKTIDQVLGAYVNSKQTNWVSQPWRDEYAPNNSVTDAYKVTPIEVCQRPRTNLRQYHQSKSDPVNSYLEMLNLG